MGGTGDLGIAEFLRELSAPTPTPGAGGALSTTAAIAAALVEMTARISADRGGSKLNNEQLQKLAGRASELGEEAAGLGDADAVAYAEVLEAMKASSDDPTRPERVRSALSAAAEPPLQLAAVAAELTEAAGDVVKGGRASVRGDALAGVVLAEAACCGASRLVAIDVDDPGDPRVAEAEAYAGRAAAARRTATK